jgi:hypothetical protein
MKASGAVRFMYEYKCDPNVELNGNSARALLRSMLVDEYRHILKQYGLIEIDVEAWYPLQHILNVLSKIRQTGNAMMDFVSIGMAAAEHSILPPEVDQLSIQEFFKLYAQVYPTRHRNGDPGQMWVDVDENGNITITLDNPYPDDLMYGMMYGFTRRFIPRGVSFTVTYDTSQPRKEHGGDVTVIKVELS